MLDARNVDSGRDWVVPLLDMYRPVMLGQVKPVAYALADVLVAWRVEEDARLAYLVRAMYRLNSCRDAALVRVWPLSRRWRLLRRLEASGWLASLWRGLRRGDLDRMRLALSCEVERLLWGKGVSRDVAARCAANLLQGHEEGEEP